MPLNDNMLEQEDAINVLPEDNTSQKNEDALADFPDEDAGLEDEGKDKIKVDTKPKSSEIAQKIKYREKYLASQVRIRELEEKLKTPISTGMSPEEQEKKEQKRVADNYIRQQAREEYDTLKAEEKRKNDMLLETFNEEVELILDEHPDLTEEQIVEVCEEYEVAPKVAAKILLKVNEPKVKKPQLPNPKRGTSEVTKEKRDDSKKSLYDIAQDIKDGLKKKL